MNAKQLQAVEDAGTCKFIESELNSTQLSQFNDDAASAGDNYSQVVEKWGVLANYTRIEKLRAERTSDELDRSRGRAILSLLALGWTIKWEWQKGSNGTDGKHCIKEIC